MKKTFLRNNSGAQKSFLKVVAPLVLIIFLLWIIERSIGGFLIDTEKPLIEFARGTGGVFAGIQEYFKSNNSLTSQIASLRSENEELMGKNRALEETIKMSQHLDELYSQDAYVGRSALIISELPRGIGDTLLVDQGIKNEVEKDFFATFDGVYIGRVVDTTDHTAKVELSSFPGINTDGYLESLSLNISLQGKGSGNLSFSLPKDLNVAVGDKIFLNSRSPYLVGQVAQINESPAEPLKEIFVRIPLNISQLRFIKLSAGL